MNLPRPLMTFSLALTFTFACVLMTGCKEESSPVASKPVAAAAKDAHDHAGHDHADHDHAPTAKSAMGTITGGVPADIKLVNTLCPVSGESFNRDDKTLSAFEYDGKHYGVCCSDCIALFKKDPAKYLAKLDTAQKALDAAKDAAKDTAKDAANDAATDVKSKASDALKSVTQ